MAQVTTAAEEAVLVDEATLDVLQARLYPRLEAALLEAVRREQERVPPYFEEFIHSEVQRLEEAIAQLNRRIEESNAQLNQRIEKNNAQLNQRFDDMRLYVDQRFAQVDQRFAQVDQRFAQVDQRFAQIDQRFDHMETSLEKMGTRFRNWTLAAFTLLGILITVLSFLLR